MRLGRAIRILVVLAILAGGFLLVRLLLPYQGFSGETFVEFPHGTSTDDMADTLAKAGIVRSRWDFLLARMTERNRVLQAWRWSAT